MSEPGTALEVRLNAAEQSTEFGRRLGRLLTGGDLLVLDGPLGAGKTTLTRGIGDGLGVRGPITSPTFVIAREHPSLRGGPALVHVDAYRLTSLADVDALDLDSSLDEAVTVVEWGAGQVEQLVDSWLTLTLRALDADSRLIRMEPTGDRFAQRWPGIVATVAGLADPL